jgi:hypothetical protein
VTVLRRESLVQTYPSDLEAQLFLASAYFGVILPENRGFMQRCPSCSQRVVELIESVRQQLPYHPGALHYLVHISDDPWNASGVVGLAALLDRVAPDSSHAQVLPLLLSLSLTSSLSTCKAICCCAWETSIPLQQRISRTATRAPLMFIG